MSPFFRVSGTPETNTVGRYLAVDSTAELRRQFQVLNLPNIIFYRR